LKRRSTLAALWTAAFVLVALLLVKAFVGDLYHVDSASMEPTIFGSEEHGERVFVVYDRSPPSRFDIAVMLRQGETTPIVKRIVGLPGESVRIVQGDLLINNAYLAPDAPRPAPVAVFDDRWHSVEDNFQLGPPSAKRWLRSGDAWEVDARDVPLNAQSGMMFLRRGLKDDHLGPDHEILRGKVDVNDAWVECEMRVDTAPQQVRIGLTEQGDTFEFGLRPTEPGRARARIVRRYRSDRDEVLAEGTVAFAAQEWLRMRCSNVDNALSFEIGATKLSARYDRNHLHPSDHNEEGKSYGSRVYLGGEGGRIAFRGIRIWRDLYYTQRGQRAVRGPLELGPDEYFALGDNSAESRDSREWGPVRARELVGRPAGVVWPFAHARRLVATAAPW
jgi:signal peptidase I